MADRSERQSGVYRCPVCGYRDLVEVSTTATWCSVVCTYCETPLEVSYRGPESVSLAVQVASEPLAR